MKRLISLSIMLVMMFVIVIMSPYAAQQDRDGDKIDHPIAIRGEPTSTIDFEFIPGIGTPREGIEINTQYTDTTGVTFSLEGGGSPVLAQVGDPLTALIGPTGSDRVREDQPRIGSFFLTDDGSHSGSQPEPLVVSYDPPTAAASGVILDIDDRERFTIEARNGEGEVIDRLVIEEGDPNTGDGVVTPWFFDRPTRDIFSLRFMGVKQDGVFGLGFDNFSARSARPEPPLPPPAYVPAYVVGQFSSRTDVDQRSVTVIRVRNNRDFQTANPQPGPCLVQVQWLQDAAFGGGALCTSGPLSVPAGQTVQFCSRRLSSAAGISGCDAVCTNNVPMGSVELAGANSAVGVAIVQADSVVPVCLASLTVSPQIVYTSGNRDNRVVSTTTPKVIRSGGMTIPTGNVGN